MRDTVRLDVLVAIDAVDDLVYLPPHRRKWNFTRVDHRRLEAAVEHLRLEVAAAVAEPGRGEALPLVEGLADLARDAKKAPIVGGVLVNSRRAYDFLDELQQVIPRAINAQR